MGRQSRLDIWGDVAKYMKGGERGGNSPQLRLAWLCTHDHSYQRNICRYQGGAVYHNHPYTDNGGQDCFAATLVNGETPPQMRGQRSFKCACVRAFSTRPEILQPSAAPRSVQAAALLW